MAELPHHLVSAQALKAELKAEPAERPFLLDVREPEEFAEVRIEGATLIPLGELMGRAEKELNRSDDIVVYCAHGVRSLHALRALVMMGFTRVRSLHGGIAAWLGDPDF